MKIGIFGGTFDPPHIGHINTCKSFASSFDFDKVFVIPVFLPPHKSLHSATTVDDRLEMCKIAFTNIGTNVEISDLEIRRQGKSYTADTIQYFKELGYDDIYFLCGTDMLLTLGTWYRPDYILANSTIVYARRECEAELSASIEQKIKEYQTRYNAKIISLNTNVIDISSTEIRKNVNNADIIKKFLTQDIINYIENHKLYGKEQK